MTTTDMAQKNGDDVRGTPLAQLRRISVQREAKDETLSKRRSYPGPHAGFSGVQSPSRVEGRCRGSDRTRRENCLPRPRLFGLQKCAQSVPSKLGLEAAPRVKSGHLESGA